METPSQQLQQITAEIRQIIAAEEIEIELLGYATGTTADVARAVRSEFVEKLKEILEPTGAIKPCRE